MKPFKEKGAFQNSFASSNIKTPSAVSFVKPGSNSRFDYTVKIFYVRYCNRIFDYAE